MSFLKSLIREQNILEAEVDTEKFLEDNKVGDKTIIHTMSFDIKVYKDEKEVREYLQDKYISYEPKIFKGDGFFVVSLVSPSQVDLDTEIQVEIRRGVTAHAADLAPIMSDSLINFNDKGEELIGCSRLFSDNQTLNLSEGIPFVIEIARVAKGHHPSYGEINITEEVLESMANNFESKIVGVDLAVNEDHLKNEAFGWFKDVFLSFDKQTLYGQVVWNTKGTTALAGKEYRYFSPEFRFNYVHPHTDEAHGPTLLGGALTNYPFLKMDAIVELNNKTKTGEEEMSKENTIDLSVHESKLLELNGKVVAVQTKLDVSEAKNVDLSNKVASLEAEVEKKKKEALNQKLFEENKISAAQLVALNEGKGMLEVLALNEKVNVEASGTDKIADSKTVNLSAEEKKLAKSLDLTDEEFIASNTKE
jgi:phage I-like protein